MPTPNPISNTSTVTTTVADEDLTDNQATVDDAGRRSATTDLAISKTGPANVTVGGNVTYTIHVSSTGPSDAASVAVTDPTPAGLTFVSNAGDCTTPFPCALGTIPAGPDSHDRRRRSRCRRVMRDQRPSSTRRAVTTTASDLDPGNNSATATTTVDPAVRGPVHQQDRAVERDAGDDASSYALTVTNDRAATRRRASAWPTRRRRASRS